MNLLKPLLLISNNFLFIFLGIFGLGFIIGFHELGHFLFGKLFKIKTPSFSIGFGPKLFKKKIGETDFSIGAIPLGGYVASDKESFESKPYYQKITVMFAGITFNMIFSYIILCLIFMLGIPKNTLLYPICATPTIKTVNISPQTKALGFIPGDKIIAINGEKTENSIHEFFKLQNAKTETTTITVERDKEIIKKTVSTKSLADATTRTPFAITFEMVDRKGKPLLESIKKGITLTNKIFIVTLSGLKKLFIKKDTSELGGPIAVITQTVQSAGQGTKIFLLYLAIISISLAVLNLIPLPILDGGQALLLTIETIIKSITGISFSERVKEYIFIATWILMLSLIVLLSARDIWRIILFWKK